MSIKHMLGELVSIRQLVGEELQRDLAAQQQEESRPPLWLKFWCSRMQWLVDLQLGQYADRLVDFTLEALVKHGSWTVPQAVHSWHGGGQLNLWVWRSSLGRLPTSEEWRTWSYWTDKDRECWPQDRKAKLMRLRVIVDTMKYEKTYRVHQTEIDPEGRVTRPWPARLEAPIPLPANPWPPESATPFLIPEGYPFTGRG
jgi:hypothetical protein